MLALVEKTGGREPVTRGALEIAYADALFASTLQFSESPTPDQVRRAAVTTLRRWGSDGCAARVAAEFGDHPDLAARRMAHALAAVRSLPPEPTADR